MTTQPQQPASPKMTWSAALLRLWTDRHTGPVVVHFAQGHPNSLELPSEPVRIKLEKP
jgi:hypothetical protein